MSKFPDGLTAGAKKGVLVDTIALMLSEPLKLNSSSNLDSLPYKAKCNFWFPDRGAVPGNITVWAADKQRSGLMDRSDVALVLKEATLSCELTTQRI